ncbi:IgGFc-binding protein-like [Osmerus eperlanus]|uniref:IgGFc-binding protein-like n=1 Tax=Osmerus eperlanus TaxID=29151 RepID=UPI002E143544
MIWSLLINGELNNLPVTLYNNKLQLYKSGWFAVIASDFGVKVSYNWDSVSFVTVPSKYAGAMCGMCGNYNHRPDDDLQMKDGRQAASAKELGQSWTVATVPGCVHGCKGPCPDCNITQRDLYATNKYCGIISDVTGPFRDCHAEVDPAGFFQNCLYDVCLYQGSKDMQCKTLTAYTAACQEKGATVDSWRTADFCASQCKEGSHYELCASSCSLSCQTLTPSAGCQAPCSEGCFCDSGFVLSGDQCVPLAQCGCQYLGRYYKNGQVFYPNGLCQQECTCNSTVKCVEFTCGPYEKCAVKNGVRSCQPEGQGVCSISGDPHYRTFDNTTYDFQGTCTYTAAQGCHLEGTHLTPFTVAVENEKWYGMLSNPRVSVAKLVAVEVYGITLTLRKNEIGMVMLNGIMVNIPLTILNGAVQVYQEGLYEVIATDFGLKVTYDLVYHVTITVPGNYHGKTCGLCGNFNDNKEDEFQLPNGSLTKDLLTFGAAWKVIVPGVVCEDGCSGDQCPQCDKTKTPVFEKDCSIITDANGPFAVCHKVINPDSYFKDCVFDTCMAMGDRIMLCNSINAYMSDCQNFGVNILKWRTPTFCPFSCPANSHYQVCAETCSSPCPGLSNAISCPSTCAEACACDSGFYFNGTGCVGLEQCSCYSDGHTFKIGETLMTEDCLGVYICQASGVVLFESVTCTTEESCGVKRGVQGCHPKQCQIQSGGVFTPFDGQSGHITASGSYELVNVCNQSLVSEWFTVVVTLEEEKTSLKDMVALYVFFEDVAISVSDKHEVRVNGKKMTLPSLIKNNISVKMSDKTLFIERKSNLRVSFSPSLEITVAVSDNMAGKLCGACGRLFPSGVVFRASRNTILTALLQTREFTYTQQYMSDWIAPDIPQW